MKTFADRENTASEPRLRFLLDSDCEELVTDPMGAKMAEAERRPSRPLWTVCLLQLRNEDSKHVGAAIPQIIGIANQVPLPALAPTAAADEEKDKLGRLVRRYSGQEANLWLEPLVASFLSSKVVRDLKNVNPFLAEEDIDRMMRIVEAMILLANRIAHINRCLNDARDLQQLFHDIQPAE